MVEKRDYLTVLRWVTMLARLVFLWAAQMEHSKVDQRVESMEYAKVDLMVDSMV